MVTLLDAGVPLAGVVVTVSWYEPAGVFAGGCTEVLNFCQPIAPELATENEPAAGTVQPLGAEIETAPVTVPLPRASTVPVTGSGCPGRTAPGATDSTVGLAWLTPAAEPVA